MIPARNPVWHPPDRLIIAAQYWEGDEERMLRLVRLLSDIEPAPRRDVSLALVRRFDCPQSTAALETMIHANQKFLTVLLRSEREGTGHPYGCNQLWAGTMDLLVANWKGGGLNGHSVFTIEADGCPIRADWLDCIIGAHEQTIRAGKRVTGPEMNNIAHVNGSLVAHLSLWEDRPSLHTTPESQGWDLFHAETLLAEARTTRRILNVYGACNWSPASLAALAKETAWLASQKDDSAFAWAEKTLVPRAGRRLRELELENARLRGGRA
jgi:hypothetical protein